MGFIKNIRALVKISTKDEGVSSKGEPPEAGSNQGGGASSSRSLPLASTPTVGHSSSSSVTPSSSTTPHRLSPLSQGNNNSRTAVPPLTSGRSSMNPDASRLGAGPSGGATPLPKTINRQESVPMGRGEGGAGTGTEQKSNALGNEAKLKAQRKAEVLAKLAGAPEKRQSLKHLLNLDQYDFVSDVNVSGARITVSVPLISQANLRFCSSSGIFAAENQAHNSHRKSGGSNLTSSASAGPNAELSSVASKGAIFSEVSVMKDTDDDDDWPVGADLGDDDLEGLPQMAEDSNVLAVSKMLPPSMRRSKWSVDDYKLLKKLHKGYASEVFVAKCKITNQLVVLKVYSLTDQCDLQRVQLYREIRLHSRLQHHNIVQFYSSFLESNCVVIVQEYCEGGDLLKVLYRCGGRLLERQAVNLVLQPCLQAMQYLHAQGIVHRDIKPENVLFTEDKILKVCDFGLAIDLNEERANTRAGTLDYMAPEVLKCPTKKTPDENKGIKGSAHYHTGVDSWAMGAFAYELLTGVAPFKAAEMIETARNIVHAEVEFPQTMSEHARDFIATALSKHPGDRPTVMDMLRHPWVAMFQRRGSTVTLRPNPNMADLSLSATGPSSSMGSRLRASPVATGATSSSQQGSTHAAQRLKSVM